MNNGELFANVKHIQPSLTSNVVLNGKKSVTTNRHTTSRGTKRDLSRLGRSLSMDKSSLPMRIGTCP